MPIERPLMASARSELRECALDRLPSTLAQLAVEVVVSLPYKSTCMHIDGATISTCTQAYLDTDT